MHALTYFVIPRSALPLLHRELEPLADIFPVERQHLHDAVLQVIREYNATYPREKIANAVPLRYTLTEKR